MSNRKIFDFSISKCFANSRFPTSEELALATKGHLGVAGGTGHDLELDGVLHIATLDGLLLGGRQVVDLGLVLVLVLIGAAGGLADGELDELVLAFVLLPCGLRLLIACHHEQGRSYALGSRQGNATLVGAVVATFVSNRRVGDLELPRALFSRGVRHVVYYYKTKKCICYNQMETYVFDNFDYTDGYIILPKNTVFYRGVPSEIKDKDIIRDVPIYLAPEQIATVYGKKLCKITTQQSIRLFDIRKLQGLLQVILDNVKEIKPQTMAIVTQITLSFGLCSYRDQVSHMESWFNMMIRQGFVKPEGAKPMQDKINYMKTYDIARTQLQRSKNSVSYDIIDFNV